MATAKGLLVLQLLPIAGALRCLDNDGSEVDWWFMYKMPGGYNFSYNDPHSGDATEPLQMFERAMNDEDNPVAITRTLQALAEQGLAARRDPSKPSYYLYNDQPDNGVASESYGHTKGVVAAAADHASGLWIVHSTPHWPASTGKAKFYFPSEEIRYGQAFLCMSLDPGELDHVGLLQVLLTPRKGCDQLRMDLA